ncbi:hypothetical protein BELL_0149g00090 [Botrytis elliptica]|uniref:2EXR domain-containing protein n=1 Tax=Botrytis elliptica TaxID=278938 RepID=A0A4Z1K5G8_9HELO|nr:hypothetical protein EAE99_004047 [Botrytis elliptica]TGO76557.1 hypothetical protein BELL_0149g00090 [Botrytis elliptica]
MKVTHNKHLGEQELRGKRGSEANANKEDMEHNYKHCKIHNDVIYDNVNDEEEIHREVLNAKVFSQLHEFTKFHKLPPEIREAIWKLAINATLTEVHEDSRHLTQYIYPQEEVVWSCKLMLRHAHTSSEARWIVARKMFRFGGDEYKHLTEKTMDRCILPVVNEITLRKVDDVITCSTLHNPAEMCNGVYRGVLSDERKEGHAKHLQKLLEA